jgi:hypothetical protein
MIENIPTDRLLHELQKRGFNTELLFGIPDLEMNLKTINESVNKKINLSKNQMNHIIELIDTEHYMAQINEDIQHFILNYNEY